MEPSDENLDKSVPSYSLSDYFLNWVEMRTARYSKNHYEVSNNFTKILVDVYKSHETVSHCPSLLLLESPF